MSSACLNCGCSDYNLRDGQFFCLTCHLHHEEFFDETVTDDTFSSASSTWNRLRIYVKKERKRHVLVDVGEQWTTFDALTMILMSQIDALIDIGATPSYEVTVLNLWIKYLKLQGVVYQDIPGLSTVPKVKIYPKKRDAAVLLNSIIQSKTPDSYRSKHKIKRLTDRNKHKNRSKFAITTTLSLTVYLLYLGVLINKEQILLSDLLRWLMEEKIPFYSVAVNVLPYYFKFQNDNSAFKLKRLLSYERVLKKTNLLAKLLGIVIVPKKPIEIVAARLILELNLPASLIGLVSNVIRKHPTRKLLRIKGIPSIVNYEARAIAYIIVLLTTLFGLNGTSEWTLSDLAKDLNAMGYLSTNGLKQFVWSDWCVKANSLFEENKCSLPSCLRKAKQPHCINIGEFSTFLSGKAAQRKEKCSLNRARLFPRETKETLLALKRPFELMLSQSSVCLSNEFTRVLQHHGQSLCLRSDDFLLTRSYKDRFVNTFYNTSLQFITDQKRLLDWLSKFEDAVSSNDFISVRNIQFKTLPRYKTCEIINIINNTNFDSMVKLGDDIPFSLFWMVDVFCNLCMVHHNSVYREITLIEKFIIFRNGKKYS